MATKYLITGAAGNLGGNIVRGLVAQGKDIRALVLPGDKSARYIPEGIEIVEGNILNPDDLCSFFKVPDGTETIVIHSAAVISVSSNCIKLVHDVNVQGTRNIVEQCIKSHVKRLVYVSSVHAIPELPKGRTMTEVDTFNPDMITGFYGKTKTEASQIVMDAVNRHCLDAVLVYPTSLCGPYDYAIGYLSELLVSCSKNKLPAGIDGGYDFVDVRDVAAGIAAACERGRKGEGYILGNRYVSIRDFLSHICVQTGARPVKLMLPIWVARVLIPFFGIYYKVKNRRPILTGYTLDTLKSNSDYSSEKAKRELGYTVRPFEVTIADTIKWLKSEGKL